LSPAKWVHALKGLTLTEVDLQLFYAQSLNDFDSLNNKSCNQNNNHQSILIAKQKGALLFTHWGISGPGVFKITSLAAGTNYAEGIFILKINLLPNIKKEELREVLKEKWKASPKRKVINAIEGLIPARLEGYIVSSMLWNPEKTYGEISNAELDQLIQYITALQIPINGIRPSGEEIVTAGGIDLNEIDSKTMQSKIVSGLYFAGEVIDIDGFTGGFNLQASWSTGWVAGNSIQV
jgi:predicted Rossmann fold flavoprotein